MMSQQDGETVSALRAAKPRRKTTKTRRTRRFARRDRLRALRAFVVNSYCALARAKTHCLATALSILLAFAAAEARAAASLPPPLYPDASNAAQPSAAQNLGIGLGSALAPGATALAAGGSGYAVGDTLTLQCAGCTFTTSPIVVVTSVNSGAINGWVVTRPGVATRLPANTPAPALTPSATSGAGSGASFTGAFAPLAAGLSMASLSNAGGNATNGNLFLTAESPDPGLAGAENTFGGDRAGGHFTGASTANTAFGHNACGIGGAGTFLGNYNTCLGDDAGRNLYRAGGLPLNGITAIGQAALRNANGAAGFATALGQGTGLSVTTGNNLTLLGAQVASTTLTTGHDDVVIGTNASCDTASAGESNAIHLCAGSTDVLTITGAGTPSTSSATFAGNLTVAGTITGASTLARSFRSPSNPAGTTSLTGVMMGLAGAITPSVTGKVRFTVTGSGNNSTAGDGWIVQLRYGTGAAPSNGGALAGTTCGQTKKTVAGTATNMFTADCYVAGLTVNTAYWFDLMLEAVTGGTATLFFIDMVAIEES
jgi:hypothetical protein